MANYQLRVAHLYGNLLNTYGDNGNLLVLDYLAKKMDVEMTTTIVSLYEPFVADEYDLVFFGGGQDYEQKIVARDLQSKKEALTSYIENDGVLLAICGGYQLLGHYYVTANDEKIMGIGSLDHYTTRQENHRFIGDIKIVNETFNETYIGFENHNGRTFLGKGERPLGIVVDGHGNNGEDQTEGVIYRNVFGSYFHGPLLARNTNLAKRILNLALAKKYGSDFLIK